MALIPSSPSKYWMRGWAVSPQRRLRVGTASVRDFERCSKDDATISGSVAVKYLRRFFVRVEMRPFSLRRFSMS